MPLDFFVKIPSGNYDHKHELKLSFVSLTVLYFSLNIGRFSLDQKSWQHFLTDLDTTTPVLE